MAVDGRADARGQAERAIAEVATLLSRAQAQFKDPDIARVNARALQAPRATVAAAEKQLQEARTALKAENYAGVTDGAQWRRGDLQAALTEIDAAASPGGAGASARASARRSRIPRRSVIDGVIRNGSVPRSCKVRSRTGTQWPSNTTSAHPVRKIPSSRHSTRCVPPGAITWTSRAAPPCAIAAIAEAHAPVPDACVGPTPRSQIRMRTRSGASTTANSTLVPSENRRCVDNAGPSRLKRARSGSSLHQRDTLRIADRQRRHFQRFAGGFNRVPRRPARAAPSPPETCSGRPAG